MMNINDTDDGNHDKNPEFHANINSLLSALDGLLFVSNQPLSFSRLAELLEISQAETETLVLKRKEILDGDPASGLQIIINEFGVQLATKASISRFIQRLDGQKLVNLSLPALETLSVIAFKQPITKAEIEAIRGVNSDGVVSTLVEKKLIYVSGEKQVLGRPRLYSTTQDFLYYFGMKSLKELPRPESDIRIDELPQLEGADYKEHSGINATQPISPTPIEDLSADSSQNPRNSSYEPAE